MPHFNSFKQNKNIVGLYGEFIAYSFLGQQAKAVK
jgi:hypothetical protein